MKDTVYLAINVHCPEYGPEVVGYADWSKQDIERLLSWKKYYDQLPKEISPYCVELFNHDIVIREKRFFNDGDVEVFEDSDTIYCLLAEAHEVDAQDFRADCLVVHITEEGLYWTWYEKNTDLHYESHKIPWSEFDEMLKEVGPCS